MPTQLTSFWIKVVWSNAAQRRVGSLQGFNADGDLVQTTPIVSITGRTVRTRNGSVYRLRGPARFPYPGRTVRRPLGLGDPAQAFYFWDSPDTFPLNAQVPDAPPS